MSKLATRRFAATLLALFFAAPVVAQDNPRQVLNPDTMPDTTQYGYSQAAVVKSGTKMVYISGQVGWSAKGPNDFESQVDRSFDNLASALAAAGSSPADVVKITLLIEDHHPAKLAYLVEKRRAFFGSAPPASTLIPVTVLYADDVSFEIDAIAVVPDSTATP